jgi:hypothetical protein
MTTIDDLLARADQTIPGLDFNRAMYETRAAMDRAVGYEVVVGERGLDELLAKELPKMTEHFSAKRLPMLGGPTAILTFWRSDIAYVFTADHFFAALMALLGIDAGALRARIVEGRAQAGFERDPWRSRLN